MLEEQGEEASCVCATIYLRHLSLMAFAATAALLLQNEKEALLLQKVFIWLTPAIIINVTQWVTQTLFSSAAPP